MAAIKPGAPGADELVYVLSADDHPAGDPLASALAALAESEARYRDAFDHAVIGMTVASPDGVWLRVNGAFAAMLGRRPDELVGACVRDHTHVDDRQADRVAMAALAAGEMKTWRTEKRYLHRDGSVRWANLTVTVVTAGGEPTSFATQIVDVTERRAADEAHRTLAAELSLLAEHSSDFLSRSSLDGVYLYASAACRALSGFEPEELVGRAWRDLVLAEDQERLTQAAAAFDAEDTVTVSHRVRRKDGSVVWWESTIRAVRDAPGAEPREFVSVSRDVTERMAAERDLSHQAMHDALTGLPNRALFLDRLEVALRRGGRRGMGSTAVLFLDIDRFKVVNDSLGHDAGDRLLVDVAVRLRRVLGAADTVARFGGDEFTIVCDDVAGELGAVAIAQRIIEVFADPFYLDGAEVYLSTSVGIALAQGAYDARPAELIRDADAAMYRAKEHGRDRFELFDAAMRADAVQRLTLETALRHAVVRGELRIHFEPEVAVGDGRVVGYEALVRWKHPERGLLPPADFIVLAEENGLIVEIGAWVLREACRAATRWEEPGLRISVNLSARQLVRGDIVATVRDVLASTGLAPELLCLELTESAVIESSLHTTATLRDLKALGVRLAIDDFGTGSALGNLRRFPIDVLKLDRSFVAGLGSDPHDAPIAAAVISLAHALGLETVAEGIETTEQLEVLNRLGCDLGQGFLFARPGEALASA